MEYSPLTDTTLTYVKDICKEMDVVCPLYKYGGEVKLKELNKNSYEVLNLLASEYSIFLDIKDLV